MSAVQEPPRWLTADHDVNEVAAHLRPALRMARGDGPSAAEHERMWGSLEAKLPAAAAASGVTASGASGAAASGMGATTSCAAAVGGVPGLTLVQSAGAGAWRIIGTGLVAAALGFAAAKLTTSSSAPAGPGEASRVACEQQLATPVELARPQPTQPRVTPSSTVPSPSLPVGVQEPLSAIESAAANAQQRPAQLATGSETAETGLRAGARSTNTQRASASNANAARGKTSRENASRVGGSSPNVSRTGALSANTRVARLQGPAASRPRPAELDPSSASPDLAAELDLLARARRVVAGSPARALQLTAEHARRFSNGVLGQEREVLAIDALSRLGQRDLAATRTRPSSNVIRIQRIA